MIIFVDVEASSLVPFGYPIEIGWAMVHETVPELVAVESHLIAPAEVWRDMVWADESEAIHRITREQLAAEGKPVREVVERMVSQLAGTTLYSDAPAYDGGWLGILFAAERGERAMLHARELPFKIGDANHLLAHSAGSNLARLYALSSLAFEEPQHRAGPDAERLAQIYISARKFDMLR